MTDRSRPDRVDLPRQGYLTDNTPPRETTHLSKGREPWETPQALDHGAIATVGAFRRVSSLDNTPIFWGIGLRSRR